MRGLLTQLDRWADSYSLHTAFLCIIILLALVCSSFVRELVEVVMWLMVVVAGG
jgi:hypothetical protein